MYSIVISSAIGYLLGSIPFGYVLVRLFRGADVRTTGSGNIGATNVARTSPKLGVATLVLDALKGLAAVLATSIVFPEQKTASFIAALAAVVGHMFPVWLKFRGGKGVATGLGSFLLLTPKAILVAVGIFFVITAAFRFVSLGSIAAAGSLPILAISLGEASGSAEGAMIAAASLMIIAKHHENIRRLMAGVEPKFQLRPK